MLNHCPLICDRLSHSFPEHKPRPGFRIVFLQIIWDCLSRLRFQRYRLRGGWPGTADSEVQALETP